MSTPLHPKIHTVTRGSNMHIIDADTNGLILIDAGFFGAKGAILKWLGGTPHQIGDIKHIIVTHADPDHIGGLAAIKDASGAQVYTDDRTKFYVEDPKLPPHLPWFFQPIMWPVGRMVRLTSVDVELVPDEAIDLVGGLTPVDTPGHTPDHMAIWWEAERVLFAGDLFFRMGKLTITPALLSWDSDVARESARKALALNPRYIYVGHGRAVDVEADAAELEALKSTL